MTPSTTDASSTSGPLSALQDRLVYLLGSSPDQRSALVAGMLRRNPTEATSYWLQLVVSVGIGTLGLVVGSTAVVIGAMLVAPLMGPIVALAMGLATRSPFLVLRATGRIAVSVAVAVGGAAAITLLLPFYELNDEILTRASPTVLDLITAGFSALAGVYAAFRSGYDATSTAAGTAISISLVPPLCASGYGLGTMSWEVAAGAGLLFLTNLVAIIVVGSLAFAAAGFSQVDVVSLERAELTEAGDAPYSRALALRLASLFDSRWGPALRFLMPVALLAAVYVPLRQALDEVVWEVRVREWVEKALDRETVPVLQSHIRIERHVVDGVIVVLGDSSDAELTRRRFDVGLRQVSGVAPVLEVLAIPDATAIAGLQSTLRAPHGVSGVLSKPALAKQWEAVSGQVRTLLLKLWPDDFAGAPSAIALEPVGEDSRGPLRVRVVHLGPALNSDAREMLEQAGRADMGRDLDLVDIQIPSEPLTRSEGDVAFIARVSAAMAAARTVTGVQACVTRPPPRPPVTPASDSSEASDMAAVAAAHALLWNDADEALDAWFRRQPGVTTFEGDAWSVQFVRGRCAAKKR